jgi:hypothetical protein
VFSLVHQPEAKAEGDEYIPSRYFVQMTAPYSQMGVDTLREILLPLESITHQEETGRAVRSALKYRSKPEPRHLLKSQPYEQLQKS